MQSRNRLVGSPPPAWGSRTATTGRWFVARFTPTRVGKPHRDCGGYPAVPVHPHPRGEAPVRVWKPGADAGSPPPAWGSHTVGLVQDRPKRFTPTRVGKPVHDGARRFHYPVHPHPRGEASTRVSSSCASNGSPPPAWGSLGRMAVSHHHQRFTPTRVGKPPARWWTREHQPVHPHPRGEAGPTSCQTDRECGSPPPAWGSPV